MSTSLSLSGIGLHLGHREVLRDVSLEVAPGEVVGLIGPNGAGKTSLLRVAAHSLRPDAGSVRVADRPVADWPRRELARRVAVVPQDTSIPFPFRVGEVVLMGRAPHQAWLGLDGPRDLERARDAMDRVGIGALADRSIFELSGGERQLVLFARGLAQEPELLLLDEPTAFLDLRHRVELLDAVRDFADAGGAALVVSHDLALAARGCDRLVLLAEGRVEACGTPDEVLQPGPLRAAYGVDTDVVVAPDGARLVAPRRLAPPR